MNEVDVHTSILHTCTIRSVSFLYSSIVLDNVSCLVSIRFNYYTINVDTILQKGHSKFFALFAAFSDNRMHYCNHTNSGRHHTAPGVMCCFPLLLCQHVIYIYNVEHQTWHNTCVVLLLVRM